MIGRRAPTALQGCVAGAIVAVAGLLVVYRVAVRTRRGQALELIASNGRLIQPPRLQGAAADLLQTISVGSLALVMMVLLGIALVRRQRMVAVTTAVMVLGAELTTEILKRKLLTRPPLLGNGPNTYPSGHSTVALSVAMAVIFVQAPHHRTLAALVGVPYALAIGTATVVAGWHRPSDVLGAWLVVGAWSFMAVAALRFRSPMNAEPKPRLLRGLALILVLFVAALGAVTLAGLRDQIGGVRVGGRIDAAKRAVAFGASMSSVALAAVVVVGAVLYLLDQRSQTS
jgi:membrane-associated phospholipid phosphatase